MTTLRTLLAATLVAGICASAPALANPEDPAPAYHLSVALDVPTLLLGAGLTSSYLLMNETAPAACAPRCDPARINPIDRPFAGRYSTRWQVVGDVATVGTLVLMPLTLIAGEGLGNGAHDTVVVAEAVLVTAAVQVTVGYAVGRPRPRLYGDHAPLNERNDANSGRSFFSGHVANCVAATLAASTALRGVHRSKLAWTTLAVGLAGSALVAVARVGAGSHFPTDVLVGAMVGTAVGIAIPALHTANVQLAPTASQDGAGVMAAGSFR
jgi:membrane-associated phospholipid phosphatase